MSRITSTLTSLRIGPVPHPNATPQELEQFWTACEHPERPPDDWVMYHVIPDCHACEVVREAAKRAGLPS